MEVSRMERIPRGRYTKEFRLEAVRLVVEGKQAASEVSRRLNISDNTLYNWIKAYKAGKLSEVGSKYRQISEAELEISQLKRELARVKMERDILKKATAYFARESQEGTR
jgi:transposase